MRRAYQDAGWLVDQSTNQCFGFSLGFDFCGEHEFGARYIKSALGITQKDIPVGVEDRTATQVPGNLAFVTYDHRSRDKRYKKTMPAAMLLCTSECRSLDSYADATELAKALWVSFDVDFATDKKWYEPQRHDIVSTWSANNGFALHVRGEENVQRLQELHDAMQRCAVSVADASIMGFKRKALSLVMNERLADEVKAEVRAQDEAFLRLHQTAEATGIEQTLEAAGKKWYALSPTWRDQEGSELLFFLNPCEQKAYAHGWFTLDELKQWADNRGPVVDNNAIEQSVKEQDRDWGIHLHMGLHADGILLRVFESFIWMDEAKTVPGARLLMSKRSRPDMPDGNYPLSQLDAYVQRGRELRAQEEAERAAQKAQQTETPQGTSA